jgi:hypothetical protein
MPEEISEELYFLGVSLIWESDITMIIMNKNGYEVNLFG